MNCSSRSALTLILTGALALACGGTSPGSSGDQGVENSALGIALSTVPAPFKLESNEGESLVLVSPNSGHLEFRVGPLKKSGINLVKEVKQRKASFEAMTGGTYLGNTELGTQIGTAFSARGSYDSATGKVEETWIYALHPTSDRLLTLTYSYPAAKDSQERVQQLLSILGEIVALSSSDSSGSGDSGGTGDSP
jgi:hypothetical protein